MMIGTVPTSVPQFILLGNWLLEGQFKTKWVKLKNNKLFWVLSTVFLIHVVGLIYTSDLNAGWDDVRTKMPLMFLPLIFFSSGPLKKNEFDLMLKLFLAGCIVNVTWCAIYSFILHRNIDLRSASRFMSHIRLGLYLVMGIATSLYFLLETNSKKEKIIYASILFYLITTIYILGLASGFFNLVLLLCIFGIYYSYKKGLKYFILASSGVIFILLFAFYYINHIYNSQFTLKETSYNSKKLTNDVGKFYYHFEGMNQIENGNVVNTNIILQDLQYAWNSVCPDDTFSLDPAHNTNRFLVLLRYMSSMEITKDSIGFSKLNTDDIKSIKLGYTHYDYKNWSYFHRRIYELVNEFQEYKTHQEINGNSLTMRLYFWGNALKVISQNPFFGVGTGDVQEAMNLAYQESKTPLKREWFKRPHNQFLTATVALGVVGLLLFLFSVFLPFFSIRKHKHSLYLPFFILSVLSFLMEDTLETQAGVTFFAFFNSLFVSYSYFLKTKN